MATEGAAYPVTFDVDYPERLSRWLIFVKWLLAFPHFIVLYLLALVQSLITFVAWLVILITGKYPRGLFDFVVGIMRWAANVNAYVMLLRDEYPPFTMEEGRYAVTFRVEHPERLSRLLIFLKGLFIIPHLIVLCLLGVAYLVTVIIAWFAILFTGRYPEGLFRFAVGVFRWSTRINVYYYLMRDEYPPFSLSAEAGPGSGRTALAVVGGLVGVIVVIGIVAAVAGGGDEDEGGVVQQPTGSPAVEVEATATEVAGATVEVAETPTPGLPEHQGYIGQPVSSGKYLLTVTAVEDPYDSDNQFIQPDAGKRFVVVHIELRNTGSSGSISIFPVWEVVLLDSTDLVHDADLWITEFSANELGAGERGVGHVGFEVPVRAEPSRIKLKLSFEKDIIIWLEQP